MGTKYLIQLYGMCNYLDFIFSITVQLNQIKLGLFKVPSGSISLNLGPCSSFGDGVMRVCVWPHSNAQVW